MQGHGCNIWKFPCITRSVLSGHAVLLLHSPHNWKCMFEPWWHPSLPLLVDVSHCWGNSTHHLPQTFLLTSNDKAHPPRSAIAAHVLARFFPNVTTRQNTNSQVQPFRLADFHRILPPSQLRSNQPPAIVSEKGLVPILVDWCVYFDLILIFLMLNSHDLDCISVTLITGWMHHSHLTPDKLPTKGVFKGKRSTKRGLSRYTKKDFDIHHLSSVASAIIGNHQITSMQTVARICTLSSTKHHTTVWCVLISESWAMIWPCTNYSQNLQFKFNLLHSQPKHPIYFFLQHVYGQSISRSSHGNWNWSCRIWCLVNILSPKDTLEVSCLL